MADIRGILFLIALLAVALFFPVGTLYALAGVATGYFISDALSATTGWSLFLSIFGFFAGIALYAKFHEKIKK